MLASTEKPHRELKEGASTQELLVQEVHHRVKNNLRLRGSMLSVEKQAELQDGMSLAFLAHEVRSAVRDGIDRPADAPASHILFFSSLSDTED